MGRTMIDERGAPTQCARAARHRLRIGSRFANQKFQQSMATGPRKSGVDLLGLGI
jgi:hypothetical protein